MQQTYKKAHKEEVKKFIRFVYSGHLMDTFSKEPLQEVASA